MSDQGAGGAYEISSRMTALIGWAATTDFAEKWVSKVDIFHLSISILLSVTLTSENINSFS